jgi:hypothetical protein
MNLRSMMVLGAISAIGLAACVVTSGPTGSTGGGGGGIGGEGGTGEGGGGVGGSGGAGSQCVPNTHCGPAITPGLNVDPSDICDGTESADLYDAYAACVCDDNCTTQCAAARCGETGGTESECQSCITAKCATELDACAKDS